MPVCAKIQEVSASIPPSAYIDALVCGYAREDRARKILVILKAFFDESASEQDERLLVVAGYVHKAIDWAFFSDEWKNALDAPPSIEYFHMVEAENLRGQFRGWKAEDRDAKVSLLADVIVRFEPWSISCSVSREQNDRIVGTIAPYDLQRPFIECFLAVIIKLAQWHHAMGMTLPIDFVFDECGIGAETAMFIFEGAKRGLTPEMQSLLCGCPVFRDDKKVLPLQAADMLAWHIRRQKETINANENRPVLDKLSTLLHAEATIDESTLRGIARDMLNVPGRQFTTGKRDSIRRILKKIFG